MPVDVRDQRGGQVQPTVGTEGRVSEALDLSPVSRGINAFSRLANDEMMRRDVAAKAAAKATDNQAVQSSTIQQETIAAMAASGASPEQLAGYVSNLNQQFSNISDVSSGGEMSAAAQLTSMEKETKRIEGMLASLPPGDRQGRADLALRLNRINFLKSHPGLSREAIAATGNIRGSDISHFNSDFDAQQEAVQEATKNQVQDLLNRTTLTTSQVMAMTPAQINDAWEKTVGGVERSIARNKQQLDLLNSNTQLTEAQKKIELKDLSDKSATGIMQQGLSSLSQAYTLPPDQGIAKAQQILANIDTVVAQKYTAEQWASINPMLEPLRNSVKEAITSMSKGDQKTLAQNSNTIQQIAVQNALENNLKLPKGTLPVLADVFKFFPPESMASISALIAPSITNMLKGTANGQYGSLFDPNSTRPDAADVAFNTTGGIINSYNDNAGKMTPSGRSAAADIVKNTLSTALNSSNAKAYVQAIDTMDTPGFNSFARKTGLVLPQDAAQNLTSFSSQIMNRLFQYNGARYSYNGDAVIADPMWANTLSTQDRQNMNMYLSIANKSLNVSKNVFGATDKQRTLASWLSSGQQVSGLEEPRGGQKNASNLSGGTLNEGQQRVADLVTRNAQENNVPVSWAMGVAMTESSLNPATKLSQAGNASANGVMQVTKAAADDVGAAWESLDQPAEGAKAGVQYMKLLHDRLGSWEAATAAYHGGVTKIDNLIKKWGDNWEAHLDPEDKAYLDEVKKNINIGVQ